MNPDNGADGFARTRGACSGWWLRHLERRWVIGALDTAGPRADRTARVMLLCTDLEAGQEPAVTCVYWGESGFHFREAGFTGRGRALLVPAAGLWAAAG